MESHELVSVQSKEECPDNVSQTEKRDTTRVQRSYYRPESWTSVGTVVLGAAVALIYLLQLIAMNTSISLSRKASERESRAWISIHQNGTLQAVVDRIISVPLRINNIGKTPAKDTVAAVVVEIIPKEQSPTLDQNMILPRYRSEIGDRFPGDYQDFDVVAQKTKGQVEKGGDTEERYLTKPEYDGLMAGKTYIAVHGRVAYSDVFKVRHWTGFCFYWPFAAKSVNASACTNYNTEDENDEP